MFIERPPTKPKLRGWIHQETFFVALGASILLVARSVSTDYLSATLIYSLSLLLLLGTSAIYHRPNWQTKPRAFLKRLDHSAIFIIIAGTFTPICIVALDQVEALKLLWIIWLIAFIGILQSVLWVKAPKFLTALFYVAMGWLALPYLSDFNIAIGELNVYFLFLGGLFYTVGAIFYALKWPKLKPLTFGYHELFHLFTVFGVLLHFIVIYRCIN